MRKTTDIHTAALLFWLISLLMPSLAAPIGGDELADTYDRKAIAMKFDFSARAVGESHYAANLRPLLLPDRSRSYLRVRAADKPRPLFITGAGRRGRLDFSLKREVTVTKGGYAITCGGEFIAEFSDYQVTPGTAGSEVAGAEWLRAPGKWRLTVKSMKDVVARDKGNALHEFLKRRHLAMQRKRWGERTAPVTFLRAKLDVEVGTPTGKALLRDQDADISITIIEAERFGRRHPYWSISISTALKVDGRKLGLKKAGPAPLEIDAVFGTMTWVPGGVRQEETPDIPEIDVEGEL